MNAFDWPGVHVYQTVDRAALLASFGGAVRYADIAGLAERRAALRAIASQAELPDYVRPNLDAIDEALRDLSWLPGDRWLIVIDGCAALRHAAPDTFAALVDIAQNAVADHSSRGASLHVVFVVSSNGRNQKEPYEFD